MIQFHRCPCKSQPERVLFMSLDNFKLDEYEDDYNKAADCIGKSKTSTDALPSYEYLYALKSEISDKVYAYYFRTLLQMNTANVSNEFRLKMFEGIDPENIMYQDELDAIKNFEDYITVYRGALKDEKEPGICWSIRKHVAEEMFYRGKLFKACIPKTSILLYLAHEEDEGEIIAQVTSNYEIIKEDQYKVPI